MKCDKRHILSLLGGMLMLLLTACSSCEENGAVKEQPTFITFYVYAPDRPMPTRAGDDQVNALTAESVIKSLQIWVFTHDDTTPANDGKFVGYLSPKEMPTADGTVYQMEVSKEFANAAPGERPNVDVYVAANTDAVGLSFDEESTRDALDDASFGNNYFGVSSPPCSTISNKGLPMSGVLRNQPVVGENPVLRIGDYDHMAKVQLQRAVSKVRFVFCQQSGGDENMRLKITGITLHGEENNEPCGFPKQEYLFLGDDGKDYHIMGEYNQYITTPTTLLSEESGLPVVECDDPSKYVYVDQDAQTYETLIDEGVNKTMTNGEGAEVAAPELTQVGPYYFRETDKTLSGTISYQLGDDGDVQTKPFAMVAGSHFYRNHSWIVYAYYGSDGLDVLTVFAKNWTKTSVNHSLYNW